MLYYDFGIDMGRQIYIVKPLKAIGLQKAGILSESKVECRVIHVVWEERNLAICKMKVAHI